MGDTTERFNDEVKKNSEPRKTAVAIHKPRLPYDPEWKEKLDIDYQSWKVFIEAIWPSADSHESVLLALSYCKQQKLDPMKKMVHIVPVYNSKLKKMVETVWPSISLLRTIAMRCGSYAGKDATEFGENVTETVGDLEITYPEYARVTIYKMMAGTRCEFVGPKVYWKEEYASIKRADPTPNNMWSKRPSGQLEKCAEAAALRATFPEECGGDVTAEEMYGKVINIDENEKEPEDKKGFFNDLAADVAEAAEKANNIDNDEDMVIEGTAEEITDNEDPVVKENLTADAGEDSVNANNAHTAEENQTPVEPEEADEPVKDEGVWDRQTVFIGDKVTRKQWKNPRTAVAHLTMHIQSLNTPGERMEAAKANVLLIKALEAEGYTEETEALWNLVQEEKNVRSTRSNDR